VIRLLSFASATSLRPPATAEPHLLGAKGVGMEVVASPIVAILVVAHLHELRRPHQGKPPLVAVNATPAC
jgi:hypothetical protein